MRIGLVVPHIFMQDAILPEVIFAPADLAISLAEGIQNQGHEVVLFTPGKVTARVQNITADLSLFEAELKTRGDSYISLLRKHAFTFVTLARQVQSELIAKAMKIANDGELDILHVYTNEEDTALPFAQLCAKPVVFTHHDPLNFLVKYKSLFPKYAHYNWISISLSQRQQMPRGTNWIANIYHGLPLDQYHPVYGGQENYVAFLGRIISTKGVHLAIEAVNQYNKKSNGNLKLKIAGKHYSDYQKDSYWRERIEPALNQDNIEYVGYLKSTEEKQEFLGRARALIIPSLFDEPFGLVMIEALATATPVIGLRSGAIPEVIIDNQTGIIVDKSKSEQGTIRNFALAIEKISQIDRMACRADFERRFTSRRMAAEYIKAYEKVLIK